MQKVLIVLLASLIGMLLWCGVALAYPFPGNCCLPSGITADYCYCADRASEAVCIAEGGIWVGADGCDLISNEPCDTDYCTEGGKCVPETSTIALLATGLICMTGYLRLRRKEE